MLVSQMSKQVAQTAVDCDCGPNLPAQETFCVVEFNLVFFSIDTDWDGTNSKHMSRSAEGHGDGVEQVDN